MPVVHHAQKTYDEMKANLVSYLRTLFPIEGNVHRLELKDVEITDNLDMGDYKTQKSARMDGTTWSVPVNARFELKDQRGRVVDRARMKIIDLPRLTNRGSYIVSGSEYMFPTQKRLRSGPYVRTGQNDELRTFFNMAKGRNFHLGMHPVKGHFQLQVDTSKNIHLYPVLRALGVTDEQMVRAWGQEAFVQNRVTDPAVRTKALKAAYEKMNYGAAVPEDVEKALRETFEATEMDAGNAELTIGKRLSSATGEAILRASAKMLRVGRGEEKEDNRDSLIHNDIVDLADYVVERFNDRQFRGRIQRTIKFNVDRRDKIAQIISRDSFQRPVNSLFTESQLSLSPTQTNPLGMMSDYTAITVRGEGGIQQDNALTRNVRALDPSHMGFLDSAHTPEGQGVGTTLHMAMGTRKKGRELTTRMVDVRKGKEVELTPNQLWKATVAFPESVDPKTNRLKPGIKRLKATREGTISVVNAKDIGYAFALPQDLLDVNTASIPFVSHTNGARVMLASKLGVQAKPLKDAEAPMVQSQVIGTNKTIEQAMGTAFSPKSPVTGVVEKITDDEIVISGKRVSLPNYFPLNNNNFVHARPTVKVGQRVKKGQVVADTNYSVSGMEEVLIRIENTVTRVRLKDLKYTNNLEVLALDCERLVYEWKPLKELIKHRTTDTLVEICTRNGRIMRVTSSHSCLTVNDDGRIVEIRPSDMVPGKTILPVAGNIEEAFEKWDLSLYLPSNRYEKNASKNLVDNAELTTDLGFLIGIYLAEGEISVKKYVRIAATDLEIRNRTKKAFQSIGLIPRETSTTIEVGCAQLARALTADFGNGCQQKNIAGWVFSTSKEFRQSLIDGFWSGDGSVYLDSGGQPRAGFQVDSEQLAKDIQTILAGLGIQSSFRYFYRKYEEFKNANEDHYRVFVGASDIQKLPTLTHKKKEANKQKWLPSAHDSICVAPVPQNLTKGNLRYKGKKGYCGRSYILRESDNLRVRALADSDILWDVVESISDVESEEFVYDLSVGDHETFVLVSGLTVHNTKNGDLAMGKNLLVAYTPYKGMNVEDGVVISNQAAAKMTSEHLYQQPYAFDAETVLDLKRFRAYFPAKITEDQAKKLDERGVIKKGQKIEPGDILVASMRKQQLGTESQRMASISRILAREYRDDSMVWDKDVGGIVQDIANRHSEVVVHVRTEEPMRIGDKIAGRHANKGIVVQILDDDEMPQDAKGRSIDIIMNPNGVVSRMNLGQILETTAGRVAEKTGKKYMAPGFGGHTVEKDLKKAGLKDHETIYDPVDNQKIPGILVGRQYIYKLEHQATKKLSARGGGPDEDYTSEEQPVRGKTGGRAIGSMELYALLAHGSLANVHEMYGVKSSFDPEVWRAIESGAPLPPARPSYAQERFTSMLRGMGIEAERSKDEVALVPFLDRHVKKISHGEITDHKLLRGKDLKEEKNGLFDTKKTGGVRGDRWTHIRLPEPMPNPTFEKAVLSLLHMTKSEFDEIMATKGGREIQKRLAKIDVAKRLVQAKKDIVGKSGSDLNALHKEIRFLRVLKERGIKPSEYVINYMPVLPPKFRPVYTLPDGSLNVSDVNFHYQATLQTAEQLKEAKGREAVERRRKLVPVLYKSMGGVMGFNDGIVERAKTPKGLARVIGGTGSPKGGYLHSRLLKKRQDVSATNVIVANPKLGLDEIGFPEATAWKTFRPFLVKELRIMGMTPLQARKAIDDKTPHARKALEKVVKERHVILNRAPTLHKFSVMAFKPKLVSGYALEIPPLIVGGFNADFDGDYQINSVVALLPDNVYNADLHFWRQREVKMSARFKTTVGYEDGGGNFVICDLSEFPHLEDKTTQDHIDFHPAAPGVRVVAMNESGGPVLAEVSGWSLHRQRLVEIVTLGSGRQIITDDDERAVYGLDASSLEWCRRRPSEASNQFVPIVDNEPLSTDVVKTIDLPADDRLRDQAPLEFDAGYFLGAIVGDGWAAMHEGEPKSVNLGSSVDQIISRWKSSSNSFFKDIPTFTDSWMTQGKLGASEGSGRATVTCANLASFIHQTVGHGADKKHLPPFTYRAPRDFVLGLLSGLWDTDGSLSWSNAKNKPQLMCSYSSTSLRLVQEIQHLLRTLGITSTITDTKTPKEKDAWILGVSSVELHKTSLDLNLAHPEKKAVYQEFLRLDPPNDRMSYSRNRLVPVPSALAKELRQVLGNKGHESMYQTLTKAIDRQYISRTMALDLVGMSLKCGHPLFERWKTIVHIPGVYFERIKNVRVTDIVEDGYDLTVPGHETFMSVDGIILSNTMGIHVPISTEANAEAAKMLPSKHLYKPGSKKLQPKIEHEYVLGLFKISKPGPVSAKRYTSTSQVVSDLRARKIAPNAAISVTGVGATTPGRILINEALPTKLRDYGQIWTDKTIQQKLVEVDKVAGRDAFVRTLQTWANIGRRYAFLTGSSFLLSDLQTMTKQRNTAYRRADMMANRIRLGAGSDADKKRKIVELYMRVSGGLQSRMVMGKNKAGKSNNIQDMMDAGARGNPTQVRQMVSNVGVMMDHENKPMPEPVRGTYAEGLDSAEFFQHMYGNRKGMIDKSQSVKDPGHLTKQVIVSAAGFRVSMVDCGTTNGIMESTSGAMALDRHLAEGIQGVGVKNALVTSAVLSMARAKGLKQIKVRSSLTCRAGVGVCGRCFGLNEEGKLPPVGDHVGIKDAQGLTEPSTQLAMRQFHTGGVAETGKTGLTSGFDRVKQLFTMPEKLHAKATLAELNGRVDSIHQLPQGGTRVMIAGRLHKVARRRKVTVKVGDQVEKAQKISDGEIQPQDMLRLKGLRALQTQLRDDIHDVYAAGGQNISHKTIETPVRMLTENVRINDAGDHPSFITGDYSTYGLVDGWNRSNASKRPVRYTHHLPGSETMPHRSDDWAKRMAHNRIQQVLTEAPAMGSKSKFQGQSPFAALIYGERIKQDPWAQGGLTRG